jgi:4-alpha-glucanotransferase
LILLALIPSILISPPIMGLMPVFAKDELGVGPQACVVYTGTHNNDTTMGWFRSLGARNPVRHKVLRSLGPGAKPSQVHWHLIRLALASVAQMAIIPWQDVLGLGSEARMNRPGVPAGNWRWRWSPGSGDEEALRQLQGMARLCKRAP